MRNVGGWALGVMLTLASAGCGDTPGDDAGVDGGDERDASAADAGEGACEPGAIEDRACGMCGTERRFCDTAGEWQSMGCTGEGVCEPGATMDEACGNCGTATSVCDTSCQWSAPGACVGEGCVPGTEMRTGDGCPAGEDREVRCNDMCAFEPLTACADQSCATVGAMETVDCGARCGTQVRTCSAMMRWEYGPCTNEGVCEPGAAGVAVCGNCGMQAATCSMTCAFEPNPGAMCVGEGACSPGAMRLTSNGCMPHEGRTATCDATCAFGAGGTCAPLAAEPYIVVPHMAAPSPARVTVNAVAATAFADVYFLVDITGSMSGEIAALRGAMSSIASGLQCANSGVVCSTDATCSAGQVCSGITGTCIEDPGIDNCVASLWTGAGRYEADYVNLLSLQANPAATSAALMVTTFGGIEELYEALVGVANPALITGETGCTGPPGGCPSFRPNTERIAIAFTDEDSDGVTTAAQATSALATAGITLIGVWSGTPGSTARSDLEAVVSTVGATPLIFDGRDAAVVPAVSMALDRVLNGTPVRANITLLDDPTDAVDATAFVDHVEVNTTAAGCAAAAAEDTNADSFLDTFTGVMSGTRICFDVVARQNDTVPASTSPQVYPITAVVFGNGAVIQRRTISFIIPSL